ncbi:hypothetical protein GF354_03115 [Candidatus Peregrinibacteria bacterium]|nr:hypothetical protein [Candidatus Peregrinibacteria bacterium]
MSSRHSSMKCLLKSSHAGVLLSNSIISFTLFSLMRIIRNETYTVTITMKMKRLYIFFVIFILIPNLAIAGETIYESNVSTYKGIKTLSTNSPGEQFGASLSKGDLNDDGINDLIIGSPFYTPDMKDWAGKVSVYFGSGTGYFAEDPDLEFFGAFSGDQLGTSITSGDYNGDGIDDLAIGAYNAYYSDYRPGKVYTVYGKAEWKRKKFDFNSYKPDFLLVGHSHGDSFGLSLLSKDINNDSIDDLLVGAPNALSPGIGKTGVVYGFNGSFSEKYSDIYVLRENSADLTFYGQNEKEKFGSTISSGILTSDNNISIAIGAFRADGSELNDSGKVYIYKDFAHTDPIIKSPSFAISGSSNNEWFGFSTDIGDIDGDGIEDLAVSSFPYSSTSASGKTTIFYGGEELYSLAHRPKIIQRESTEAKSGAKVLLSDINKDLKADLIIGAPGVGYPISEDSGDTYIAYTNRDNLLAVNSIISGEKADDWFGYSLETLDFNNDGFLDLAVGARYSDKEGAINSGRVYLIFGNGRPIGNPKYYSETGLNPGDEVSRGKFVSYVIDKFDLKSKNSGLLQSCYDYIDFCMFDFMAQSSYDDISFSPEIILYPDVKSDHKYYEAINTATMLGIINGFMSLPDSPFMPDAPITKIQALKVILGANKLVENKYRFELVNELGSESAIYSQESGFSDVDSRIDHMWWYPRYTLFAKMNNLVSENENFYPDENISLNEMEDLVNKTLKFINSQDA